MTDCPTARTIAEHLGSLVAEARRRGVVTDLSASQIAAGPRLRGRLRVPGSSRHLADVITERPGPAGIVTHGRVAGALRGHPAHALDEVLVLAIVAACHDQCGRQISDAEIRAWQQLVRRAARRTAQLARPSAPSLKEGSACPAMS